MKNFLFSATVALMTLPLLGQAEPISTECTPLVQGELFITEGGKLVAPAITITAPGNYCLAENVHYAGEAALFHKAAISIESSNVTLDLSGYNIIGPKSVSFNLPDDTRWAKEPIGIFVGAYSNVVIKNGSVDGFKDGIEFGHELGQTDILDNLLFEDLRILNSTSTGMVNREKDCHNCTFKNNYIAGFGDAALNITGYSEHLYIVENTFADIRDGGYGIRAVDAQNAIIEGNRFIGSRKEGGSAGQGVNIYRQKADIASTTHLLLNNTFNNLTKACVTGTGVVSAGNIYHDVQAPSCDLSPGDPIVY